MFIKIPLILIPTINFIPKFQKCLCGALDKTMLSVNPRHAAAAVRTALRWTPDRIIFGEVRYGEVANELLI
jgi:Tfp pilus assembly ATPase PilU